MVHFNWKKIKNYVLIESALNRNPNSSSDWGSSVVERSSALKFSKMIVKLPRTRVRGSNPAASDFFRKMENVSYLDFFLGWTSQIDVLEWTRKRREGQVRKNGDDKI